jgi:hypothetical protein
MKTLSLLLTVITLISSSAFADEGSYELLIKSGGSEKVGKNNQRNTSCVFLANEDGVYFNFKDTDLSMGFSMGYDKLSKGWFSSTATYNEPSNPVCHWLTPNHCGGNGYSKIKFITSDETGLITKITAYSNDDKLIDECSF